ncbi:MAG: hypothetical protein PHN59_02910 [Candidatus Omnitrophica bacterium]|nr:hypothetical protein [Candidatus Omnitrophota bacterium]
MCRRIYFLLLMFFLMFTGGNLFAQSAQPEPAPEQQPETQRVDKIQNRVDELTKELDLTLEQQTKVKEVLEKATQEIKTLLQATKDKAKEIRVKAHDEIMSLLTTQQQAKFQVTRKKNETNTLPAQ